jgi:putrescine---pyruvate transaminase
MPNQRDTSLWHPFANMASVRGAELTIEYGDDVWVWDSDGRRYLDATASLWYANIGHGRNELAQAATAQLEKLEAYSVFGDLATPPALELAQRLSTLAPMQDARVFFGSGGADGIETAAKLARRFWQSQGEPNRLHVIGRTAGYHGTHAFGTSIGGIEANAAGFGELVAATSHVAHDSVDALKDEIERVGKDRVAAFFFEPVIGAGGVYPPTDGYIHGVAEVCRDAGVLLVADCVICGFGRLGGWFGVERFGIDPDMVVFAKGVTSGYLPLGGVLVSDTVAQPFWSKDSAPWFRHGPTYAGHATCCAVALKNLDILERENLVQQGARLEQPLVDALSPLTEHPLVDEIRGGIGFLAAVELNRQSLFDNPLLPIQIAQNARQVGVLLRPLGSSVAVSPPLTATSEHLELIYQGYKAALDRSLATIDQASARRA